MGGIAEVAGAGARHALPDNFPSRDALLQGLAERALAEMRASIADAGLDTVNIRRGIAWLVRIRIARGSTIVAIAPTPGQDAYCDAGADRRVGEPIRALRRGAIADGTLCADLSPEMLAALLHGLVEQGTFLVMRRTLGVEQASDAVTSLFLNGAASVRDGPPWHE